jgi:hypothetical protein
MTLFTMAVKEESMKKVAILLILLLLSACGEKLEGTTYSDNGTIFGQDRVYTFKFGSGGKVERSIGGQKSELRYEVHGDKVKITGAQWDMVFTLREDGSLQNVEAGSLKEGDLTFRKKETTNHT